MMWQVRLENWLLGERRRWFLWLPVLFGAGALIYFSLTFEPGAYLLAVIACLLPCAHYCWQRGWRAWVLLAMALVLGSGFVWAKIYTDRHQIIMLEKEQRITAMSGQIIEISDVPKGYRITLDHVQIEGLDADKTPGRVRVKLRGSGHELLTGQWVKLRAGLLAPTGPVMPGAFDFARYFYFLGIGAVGYAIPPAEVIEQADTSESDWRMWLTRQREALSDRIRSQMSSPEGAVAAALMTGDRAAIPDEINQVMRDTNLSHILAISGMHMALVTGMIYFAIRFLLVCVPLTRHLRHIKKTAAMAALVAGCAYLFVAGFPISALRAYIMVALIFAAILLDRQVMPMRSLALAAMVLLIYKPAYVLEPGFQLSFTATAALIAWYERVRETARNYFQPEQRLRRAMIYLGGVLMTSLVAELATTPLVLYHFNQLSLYGMLANMIVMPIVSFLIMPAVIISFVLMPFELESIGLQVVEWGIGAMIAVSRWVASIPHAQQYMTAPPGWAVALMMLGFCWLLIWQTKVRLLGLLPAALGLMSIAFVHHPDLFISPDGKQIAAVIDGKLVAIKGRVRGFVPEQWAHGTGEFQLAKAPKQHDAFRCDDLGCVYRAGDNIVAMPATFEAMHKDCARADVVLTSFYLRARECSGPLHIIDRRALEQSGAHWLWLDADEMTVQTTADVQGDRAWSKGAKN